MSEINLNTCQTINLYITSNQSSFTENRLFLRLLFSYFVR